MPIFGKRRPFADGAEPIADQIAHHRGVDRDFPPTAAQSCGLRTLDERANVRCCEQLAPRRADARAEVVGFQQHGARGAQVGVEPVVPLLLVLELLGRDVGRGGAGSPDLGVSSSRRFAESARRGVSSATAPCSARASASLWARRPANPRRRGSCP